MKYRKYKAYIRKISSKDKSESLRTTFQMAYNQELKGNTYVLVQHGVRNIVIEVGKSKEELKNRLCYTGKFKDWQIKIKKFGKLKL